MKTQTTISTIFLLAAQLLWSAPSFATDYYVHANVGSNLNSGLHPGNAFATLRYAMWQLRPGDTLYIRSGVYDESVTLSPDKNNNGTSTLPIVVKPYQSETTVISGVGIAFKDISWWILEDLVFEHSANLALGEFDASLPENSQCTSMAENITIRRSIFQHGSKVGVRVNCGRHIKIENNIFDNLRSRTEGKDTNALTLAYYANDISVVGNRFTDIGSAGVHILDGSQFTDIRIIDNEFEIVRPYRYRDESGYIIPEGERPFDNVGETGITIKQGPGPILVSNNRLHGFRPSIEGQDATGAIGTGINISILANGITVTKNHFYDNSLHINAGIGANTSVDNLDVALRINNNIFEDAADTSINGRTARGMYLHKVNNVKVLNNTFHNPSGHEGTVLELSDVFNVDLNNNVFRNGKVLVGASSLAADYNTWSGVTGVTFTGEIDPVMVGLHDVVTADPKINSSTWEPLDGSPLIDTGTPVGITEDFNGAPLSGLGPDIGAVEYQDTIQVADTQSPTVSITGPNNGATVSGNIQVNAVAVDNIGVSKVTFAIDGAWVAKDTTAPYTFNWDSSTHADGTATIRATAYDQAGNSSRYAIDVTVNNQGPDTESPGVVIATPGDGATVSGNVQVNAVAVDNIGISKVTFAVDGAWVAKDTTAPYTFNWDSSTHADGAATIRATAFDLAGNSSRYAIDVTVNNQDPDPVKDTTAPVISAPPNKTVEATGPLTDVDIGTASATDGVDGAVTVVASTIGPFAVGTHTIIWSSSDSSGNTGTVIQTIIVVDTTAPTVIAPTDISIQSTDTLTDVLLGNATASDLVDGVVLATPSSSGPFTVGSHTVTWQATDLAGNTGYATQVVTVYQQVDTTPPQITAPPDITVGATGILTNINLGQATSYDDRSGQLMPVPDNTGPFTSGAHQITWRATDAAGNASEAIQYVTVLPQVDFSIDQNVSEGANATVTALLSGEAAEYPITIPYIVTGTAMNPDDHDASDGEIVIISGTTGSVSFKTVDDGTSGELAETVIFEMKSFINAVPGTSTVHTVTINEDNAAPLVDLAVAQSGIPTRTVYLFDGPVVIDATVRDSNTDDIHQYDWSLSDNRLVSNTGLNAANFTLDPQHLEPGLYTLHVTVTDSGEPAESTTVTLALNVSAERPLLSDLDDQDNDGLSDAVEGTGDADQDGIPDYLDNITNLAVLQGLSGVSDHHLLVANAGVQLKLGATALAAGNGSALVSLDEINTYGDIDGASGASKKKSSDFPGGLYDFEITGLSEPGQSIQIVLAQFTPLPKAATYRKYIPGAGWQNFIVNSTNRIASAPGSYGVCPAPGDPSYRNGLHFGDYCIQLSIEDGGPNDTDGLPNGVIHDPGGVEVDAQTASLADSSNRIGAGCTINTNAKIDPVWLFLMAMPLAVYSYRRLR